MIILSVLFFVTAILYSSVGFGGGSTYLALLLIWNTPYHIFPVIALCCNIIVVSGNCFNYTRAGNLNLKLLFPYLIGSIPFAFFGGSLIIETIFSLDGLGRLGFEAALTRDYPVMFGTLYFFGLLGLIIGLISDLVYVLVDPRIDFEGRNS